MEQQAKEIAEFLEGYGKSAQINDIMLPDRKTNECQ